MDNKRFINITAIIEARMNSSRLPGKVLLEVNNQPMLYYLVKRLKSVKLIDTICLATTTDSSDDVLESFAKKNSISCFRGSENDVMGRVLNASHKFNADLVIEITGDCPLIDPNLVSQAIEIFINNDVNYVNNNTIRSYPDGMDIRIFEPKTLLKSYNLTKSSLEREHVTLHIKKNPDIFSYINIIAPPNLNYPNIGLTLDEESDYILIKKIIESLSIKNILFDCETILNLINKDTHLLKINKDVKRKGDN